MHRTLKITSCSLCLVLTQLNLGCSPDPDDTPAFTARDSLGVRIVENIRPLWEEGMGWRLSEKPALSISSTADDSSFQLYRIHGAFRLPDGRIVVGNSSSQQILFFHSSGRFERAVGGPGGGPGEFTKFMSLTRKGEDSLLVFDPMQSRVSILDREGIFSRSFDVERPGQHTIERVLPFIDDSFLLVTGFSTLIFMYDTETGVKRYPKPRLHLSSSGVVLDTLAIVRGSSHLLIRDGEKYIFSLDVPYGYNSVYTTHLNSAYFGEGDTFEIRVYDCNNGLVRIIRREIDLTISPSDIDKARNSVLERKKGIVESSRITEKHLAAISDIQKKPAFSALIKVDPDGRLWVSNHRPYPKNYRPESWSIFREDGRWLGDLLSPPDFMVTDIGSDYVLGVQFDENEFESVKVFEILKK